MPGIRANADKKDIINTRGAKLGNQGFLKVSSRRIIDRACLYHYLQAALQGVYQFFHSNFLAGLQFSTGSNFLVHAFQGLEHGSNMKIILEMMSCCRRHSGALFTVIKKFVNSVCKC